MEESIRVSERVLRMAGLLPTREPQQITVEGGESVPQPDLISQVFGKPYVAGKTTIIPVARVRSTSATASPGSARLRKSGDVYGTGDVSTPVALIEVGEEGVRVRYVFDMLPVVVAGLLVGAWNVYWLMRTLREWRRS